MPAVRSIVNTRSATLVSALLLSTAFIAPAFGQIETVVVTAERRSQDLQTVPVAVTAFTAADRDKIGIVNIEDMAAFTPGMTYSTSTDRVTVRGISRQTNVLSADSGVANYSDGIYQSFAVEAGRTGLTLGRVEILRGPQGTLYGRNSIGGAINQISRRPDDTLQAEFRANMGTYNYSFLEGRISGPIADNWQASVYADWEHQGIGYQKSIIPGRPEEGQVLNKWYVEGQIQGTIGAHLDVWARVYSTAWNNQAGDAGANSSGWTPSGFPTYEFAQANGLILNPGYGCTAIPGATGFTANTTATAASSPIGAAGCTNAAITSPWRVGKLGALTTTSVPGAYFGTTQLTYHTDMDFDVKFISGAEWYRYVLTLPGSESGGFDAPISSITIGTTPPATAVDIHACGGFTCPALTYNPQEYVNYQQQEFFTQNELNFQSTGDSPFQWQAGIYSFIQHESQPVSVSILGAPQLAAPVGGPPEGPFTLPHSPLSDRYFDVDPAFNDTSLAVYGQADYKFNDEFKLTGGLRYSYDRKYGFMQSRLVQFPLNVATFGSPEVLGAFTPAVDFTTSPLVIDYGTSQATGDKGLLTPVGIANRYNPATGFAFAKYGAQSSAITGMVDFDWTPDDTTLVYAKYARGYKGGGFNTGIFAYLQPHAWVNPEHVNSFEVGLKKTLGDWLLVDAAVYYYGYDGMQIPVTVAAQVPGALSTLQFINIPHAVSEGFEMESILTPIEHLTFTTSYSFDEAHVTSSLVPKLGGGFGGVADPVDPNGAFPTAQPLFTPAQCLAGFGTTNPCAIDAYTLGTAPGGFGWVIPQSLKGMRLPNVPKNKIALNLRYDFHIADFGLLTPSVTYIWRSSQYGTIFSRPWNLAPSWDQWDGRLNFASPDGKWNLIFYGRNIGNKIGYDTGAVGSRLSGSINRSCAGAPLVAPQIVGTPCTFVQGAVLGAPTPHPPGYNAVTNEGPYGTRSNFSINPPETYGFQIQFRL